MNTQKVTYAIRNLALGTERRTTSSFGAGCASEGLRARCNSRFACPGSTPIFWSSAFEVAVKRGTTSSWANSPAILAFLQKGGQGQKLFHFFDFFLRNPFLRKA